MSDADKIIAILRDQWADEADIVGNSTIIDVARSVISGGTFQTTSGGADMNVKDVLDILVPAATLIKVTLEIWKLLKEKANSNPKKADVEAQVLGDPRVASVDQGIRRRIGDIVDLIAVGM